MSLSATDSALKGCAKELRHRDALPMIETGQMADSYDTLHGVRFITLILQTTPAALPTEIRLHYSLYLFDAFIIQNLQELIQRATQALIEGQVALALDHLS